MAQVTATNEEAIEAWNGVLFDRFASSFDDNLSELGYRAPELLASTLGEYVAPDGRLEIYPNQGSGVLTSMVWADGLIDNPGGRAIKTGDTVQFLPLGMLLQ